MKQVLGMLLLAAATAAAAVEAPLAAKQPRDVTVHGDARVDDYYWLRDKDDPAVRAHLQAEAAFTAQWFAPLKPLSEQLYTEILGRIQQADEAVPRRDGRYWYSSKTLAGAQYPVFIRRAAKGPQRVYDAQAPEQQLLDLNQLATGRKFLATNFMAVSPDDKSLAYTVDETGARDFELRVKDIASGADSPWREAKTVGPVVWSADGRQLFYLKANAAKRSYQLWRHAVNGKAADALVFEETDELFNLNLGSTADKRFLMLTSLSKDSAEVRLLRTDRPLESTRPVLPRAPGLEQLVEHHAGQMYLRLSDKGPNYRLLRLPLRFEQLPLKPAQIAGATELLAHREGAQIEALTVTRSHLAVQMREGGSVKLRVYPHGDFRKPRELPFKEPVYAARSVPGEYDTDQLRVAFQSMTTPNSTYDYGLRDGQLQLRKVQPVLGGFDASRYESQRVWAKAADGTEVPISLVYAKALRKLGPQPLLLQGYGAYGIPSDPSFSSLRLSLLDRGVVFAIAHVRGGGDLGRRWYQDGKLAKKMNSFTDFTACADALVRAGWTTPEQLIATGGSAGGLLMGAVVNLRPELFKAVVMEVPFVDVINTMLDESIPLTTEEFIEWGNPKIVEQYGWMRAYSPYDNLKAGAYPAILARTALNDSQVPYWEPAKYVAKLRTLKSDVRPLLFDINMDAGHGGASGRFDALKERAKVYAFMLQQWGLER